MSRPDITPDVRFDLRPSYEELIAPIDDAQDARVWRELAEMAIAQLHTLTQQHAQLRARLREALNLVNTERRARRTAA